MKQIGLALGVIVLSFCLSFCSPTLPDFEPFESDTEEVTEGTEAPIAPTLTLDRRRYSFTGKEEAISAEDDLLTIRQAGSYRLTGTLSEGGLCVDVGHEGVVRLILSGVTVESTRRPALHVRSAAAVILECEEGSVNLLRSTAQAVILSRSNLSLWGTGSLSLGGAPTAIRSDGYVTVRESTLRITASECGISAEKGIEIVGGAVAINAAAVGLATKEDGSQSGGITLSGGSLTAVCSEVVLSARYRIRLMGGTGSFEAPGFYRCERLEQGKSVKGEILHTGGSFPDPL